VLLIVQYYKDRKEVGTTLLVKRCRMEHCNGCVKFEFNYISNLTILSKEYLSIPLSMFHDNNIFFDKKKKVIIKVSKSNSFYFSYVSLI